MVCPRAVQMAREPFSNVIQTPFFFFFFQNDESSFVCISGALVIVQSFTYKMGSHRKKQVMTSDPPPTDWKLHTSSIALSILSAAATCESRLGVGVSASGARPSKGTWVFSFPSLRRWWCAKINWPALSTPPSRPPLSRISGGTNALRVAITQCFTETPLRVTKTGSVPLVRPSYTRERWWRQWHGWSEYYHVFNLALCLIKGHEET